MRRNVNNIPGISQYPSSKNDIFTLIRTSGSAQLDHQDVLIYIFLHDITLVGKVQLNIYV